MKAGFKIIRYCLLSLFWGTGFLTYGQESLKQLTDSLNRIIDRKQDFICQKEKRIEKIKHLLKDSNLSMQQEYSINSKLHDEYKKFNVDSAIHYTKRNIEIATAFGEHEKEYDSSLKLSVLYSMCGMYREAEQILKEMPVSRLSRPLHADYYDAYCRFWEYYAASTAHNQYASRQQDIYLDSLQAVEEPSSFRYKINEANRAIGRDPEKARKLLAELLATEPVGSPQYAIITCSLALLSRNTHEPEQEKRYFMLSAISDMWNATRENFSLQSLALIYYENKDLPRAFKYTQSAIDDAINSGIQFRATQMYGFYSVISAAHQAEEAKVKSNLLAYLTLISLFSVFLAATVIYIYRQMKKNLRIKEELSESNRQLQRLNLALNEANEQLNSKNHLLEETSGIKEQYIAQFFDLCSSYIDKMEEYQNSLYKLAMNRRYEMLVKQLKSTASIDEELNALYAHFDSIFLSLYPSFVSDFNALLEKDGQITPKSGNLLNKELRIYALLRLGITDGAKIASFLRCSTSTIYNYRTKIRNKAIVNREDFENRVMQIGIPGSSRK